jgi:predicted RNase H-like nuclease (RuvC/YqgF family)
MKEKIRKLEQNLDKAKRDNDVLMQNELKSREVMSEQTNRIHLLQKELDETKEEIIQLKGKMHKINVIYCYRQYNGN